MDYFIARKIRNMDFDQLNRKVREELQKEGFGVITEIDIAKTLKEKINVDFRKYLIIGACNPHFAHRALSVEDKIGTLLPCNVVLQEARDGNGLEVLAFDPASPMMAMDNQEMAKLAAEVREKLNRVLNNLG
jgi:uncharacterized protein (DUF302 family)